LPGYRGQQRKRRSRITTTARNREIDHLRREARRRELLGQVVEGESRWAPDDRSIIAVTATEGVAIGDEPNPGFVVVDVAGTVSPTFIPTPERMGFAACSWQRLASEQR
jgi:hypothetical protein